MGVQGKGCTWSNANSTNEETKYINTNVKKLETNNIGLKNLHNKTINDYYTKSYVVNNIKILYTNARSLTSGTKMDELKILVNTENIDIVGITETWGRNDIMDSEMDIPGFKLYRKDSSAINNKKGGGVALFVKSSSQSVQYEVLNSKACESIWSKIFTNKVDYFVVGICYRSPEADDDEINELFNTIRTACSKNEPNLIMGDFNFPDIDWISLRTATTISYKFVKLILDCYLKQHVKENTRNNSILDLILTTDLIVHDKINTLSPIGNSDHNVLKCTIECNSNVFIDNLSSYEKLCYNKADYNAMRAFVKNRLSSVNFTPMSASEMWATLNDTMQDAIKHFVPLKRVATGKKSHCG